MLQTQSLVSYLGDSCGGTSAASDGIKHLAVPRSKMRNLKGLSVKLKGLIAWESSWVC